MRYVGEIARLYIMISNNESDLDKIIDKIYNQMKDKGITKTEIKQALLYRNLICESDL
ncbi:MAG: hypothetical protein IJ880_11305 [Bacilli bacterium]|nr:hypothetical protein [Bacilli bacterium]